MNYGCFRVMLLFCHETFLYIPIIRIISIYDNFILLYQITVIYLSILYTNNNIFRSILIPIGIFLHFGTSSRFSYNNLIDLKDGNSCFWGQSDSPFFCFSVVMDFKIGNLSDFTIHDIDSMGLWFIGWNHFRDELVSISTSIFS